MLSIGMGHKCVFTDIACNLVLLPGRGLGPRRLPMHREMVEVGSGEDAIGYSCGTGASVCCDCGAHEHRRLRKSA